MPIIVQKYGGTSVANPDRIANVANRVVKGWRDGNKMVVVLSAMAGETDRLINLAKSCPMTRTPGNWTCSWPPASR